MKILPKVWIWIQSSFICCILTSNLLLALCAETSTHETVVGGAKEHVVTKVNKCCPPSQFYNVTVRRCEPYQEIPSSMSKDLKSWKPHGMFVWSEINTLELEWKNISVPNCPMMNITSIVLSSKEGDPDDAQYFFSNEGTVFETTYDDFNNMFSVNHLPQHYCVDPTADGSVLRLCPPTCDEREPCFRKCCPYGEHYVTNDEGVETCVKSNETTTTFELPLYNHPGLPRSNKSRVTPRVTSGTDLRSSCAAIKLSTGWSLFRETAFKVLTDSSLAHFSSEEKRWQTYEDAHDYCLERVVAHERHRGCKGEEEVLFYCKNKTEGMSESRWARILSAITLIIAIICLWLAGLILFLLMDRVNLHSWTRLSFVASEFILLFLFLIVLYSPKWKTKHPTTCKALAIIFHFVGLMTMCWLSVINFDLWWTFKVLKPTSSRRFDIRRFAYYTCFALGLPALIIVTALGIQSTKPISLCEQDIEKILKDNFVYPDYGEANCSLGRAALGAYWYGPLCFLLLANLIFFLTTTCRMVHLRRLTRRASVESTNSGQNQSRIFMKIFIVSGITWNVELIGWIFNVPAGYRLDVIHHLQAIALFIIFVCKKEVVRSLQVKYPVITKVIPPIGKTRSATLQSMSTEASSRSRLGRKMSTISTNSIVTESYQRHESFELPASISPNGPETSRATEIA